jgi:hypothetical protein
MRGLRQYEKDERNNLRRLVNMMNDLHSVMGGRDKRPERKALVKCMNVLDKCINEMTQRYIREFNR